MDGISTPSSKPEEKARLYELQKEMNASLYDRHD
jgi:hypothetical protein